MSKVNQQILIIGLGKFGMSVAEQLSKYECEVMAVDNSYESVDAVSQYVTKAVRVDAVDSNALKEIGVSNFDIVILGIGDNIESSIMIALTLKELGAKYIIAKSRDDMHTRVLTMLGVDKIVQPERDSAIRLVRGLVHKNLVERMEFSKDYSIIEVSASEKWIGKKLSDLALRQKHNLNIICIKKTNEDTTVFPTADYEITAEDNLMVIAPNKEIEKMGWM